MEKVKRLYFTVILLLLVCASSCADKNCISIVKRKNTMNDTEYVVMKFGQTAQTVYMPRCYVDGNGKECINLKIAPDYETIFSNKSQTILIVLSYREHMRAFDTILKRIYNDDDVGKLHCLQIDLSAWGDETCNITAEYLNNYSNDGSIDNLGLQKTFMNSHLLNDLKARLKQYNLHNKANRNGDAVLY